jgi:hypothetical protein
MSLKCRPVPNRLLEERRGCDRTTTLVKESCTFETIVRRVLGGIILLACARFLRYKDGESVEKCSGDGSGKAQMIEFRVGPTPLN